MEHDLELSSPILEIVDRTIHICSYVENLFYRLAGCQPSRVLPSREPSVSGMALDGAWNRRGLDYLIDFWQFSSNLIENKVI